MKSRPEESPAFVTWVADVTAAVIDVSATPALPPSGATVSDHSGPEGDPPNDRAPCDGPPDAPEESSTGSLRSSSRWYSAAVSASGVNGVLGRVNGAE